MEHMDVTLCNCCGLAVDLTQRELCPRCRYPVQPDQERQFLERAVGELQRVARYGGASLRVSDLLRRYEGRLQFLFARKQQESMQRAAQQSAQTSGERVTFPQSAAQVPVASLAISQSPRAQDTPEMVTPVGAHANGAGTPGSARPNAASASGSAQPNLPAMPLAPAASMRGFSLSSDAVVNIVAALGGFFLLAGSLSFVLTTSNLWLSFLAVFLLHGVFGGAGLLTRRRVPLLRAVSPLYTLIFALLVPLVGFSAYRLVTHGLVALSPFTLLTLASLYAAVTYLLLAVTQRFVPFAYLGLVALVVADLALAETLHMALYWWPCMALLLAFPATLALPDASGETWPFGEAWAILRLPSLVLMWVLVGAATLSLCGLLSISLLADSSSEGLRLALFILAVLLFAWTALWIGRTARLTRAPLLAYLLPEVLLLAGYALRLDRTGYVLLLAGTALAYHMLARVSGSWLTRYGQVVLNLDGIAIGLSGLILLLTSTFTPVRLLSRAMSGPNVLFTDLFRPVLAFTYVPGNVFALALCLLITLDITCAQAGYKRIPAKSAWCWLLLLSGLLLAAVYSQVVLFWSIAPLGAFLALSLALLFCAVLVRTFASSAWSNPLDLLALLSSAFTLLLSLGQTHDVTSALLLGFAALLYGVLLMQHRPLPTPLVAVLLALALPLLLVHPALIFGLSLLLPLCAASLQRAGLFKKLNSPLFAWVLLVPALLYGLVLGSLDLNSGQSAFASWPGLHPPMAYDLVILGAAWYAAALLARASLWLIPATICWLTALLLPTNNFWVLTALVPLLAVGAAWLDRRGHLSWAAPLYLAALCGSGMVVFTGLIQLHWTALSWILLVFALLAYILGLFSGRAVALWLTPFYATGAIIVAATLLGDLYRPPIVALVCAALGLAISRTNVLTRVMRDHPASRFAAPLYVTALAAAVLTGISGTLGNLNQPFYGAVPDALLLYALVAFATALLERRSVGNWLVAGFACWSVLLSQRLAPGYIVGVGIGLALLGLLSGRLFRSMSDEKATASQRQVNFTWSWPWYVAFLVANLVLIGLSSSSRALAPDLLVFTLLALLVLIGERAPELLFVPAGLAAWTLYLWVPTSQPALLVVAFTILCIVLFATQFIWRLIPAATHWLPETSLHNGLSLGGLCLVLLYAINQGALLTTAGNLAHAGVFALVTLGLLLALYGQLHPSVVARAFAPELDEAQRAQRLEIANAVRHWCAYGAGLLLSLAVPWEMLAAGITRFDVLALVPASYLIVVSPFILRDKMLPERYVLGQAVALLGAALLLLPSLWFSFNGSDLLPTMLLLGEALALLIMGLASRVRIFILSSAALIIVGTVRLLFLSIPQSVPLLLMAFGTLLIVLATALILSRRRLQQAWSQWI